LYLCSPKELKLSFDNLKQKIMKLLLLTIVLLGIAFAGIAIKIWAKKDGKFAGTCASQSPFLNKDGENCSFCGKTPEQMKDCSEPKHS
jgi:hypothetical protein